MANPRTHIDSLAIFAQKNEIKVSEAELLSFILTYRQRDALEFSDDYYFQIKERSYFKDVAERLKIQSSELLGLIKYLLSKPFDNDVDEFFEYVAKKLNLTGIDITSAKAFIVFVTSRDISELFWASKVLNMSSPFIILISKGLIPPKFLTDGQYRLLGIKDDNFLNQRHDVDIKDHDELSKFKDEFRKLIGGRHPLVEFML